MTNNQFNCINIVSLVAYHVEMFEITNTWKTQKISKGISSKHDKEKGPINSDEITKNMCG